MDEPIKPFPNAVIFVGKRDEKCAVFFPENSSYRTLLRSTKPIRCNNHVIRGSETIELGNDIVAVKWKPAVSRSYTARFYCSVACQRNDAVGFKAGERDDIRNLRD